MHEMQFLHHTHAAFDFQPAFHPFLRRTARFGLSPFGSIPVSLQPARKCIKTTERNSTLCRFQPILADLVFLNPLR
jgi:hypothetical protein